MHVSYRLLPACWVAALALAALPARSADDACYQKAQTQAALNACAATALKREDDALNRLYQQMQARLPKDDAKARALLRQAERAWMQFRDNECAFAAQRVEGASLYPMVYNGCLADMTRERGVQLQNHLACGKGADEQTALQCALPPAVGK